VIDSIAPLTEFKLKPKSNTNTWQPEWCDQELLNIKEIRDKLYYDWSFKQYYALFEDILRITTYFLMVNMDLEMVFHVKQHCMK